MSDPAEASDHGALPRREAAFELKPAFRGRRFEGGVLPLAVLPNLVALQELIVLTAKWRFREANDRQRVPKGFTADLTISLGAVEDGSAVAVLRFLQSTTAAAALGASQAPHLRYYEEAIDRVHASLAAVGDGASAAAALEHLPQDLFGRVARLGRGLDAGESLMVPNRRGDEATLTPAKRKAFIRASGSRTFSEDVVLYGRIGEADRIEEHFRLTGLDGLELRGVPFPEVGADNVIQAFNEYKEGQRVRVAASATLDHHGVVQRLDAVEEVELIDARDIQARLIELAALPRGWDADGAAERLDADRLGTLAMAFEHHWDERLPLPAIFPSAGNGLHLEFAARTRRAELDVDLATLRGEWFAFDSEDDAAEEEDAFEVGDFEGFDRFVASARGWLGVSA